MEGLAAGDLAGAVPQLTRADEVARMLAAVPVFKNNLIRTCAREEEAAQAGLAAEEQREAGMYQMADGFEAAVGDIIGMVSSATIEL